MPSPSAGPSSSSSPFVPASHLPRASSPSARPPPPPPAASTSSSSSSRPGPSNRNPAPPAATPDEPAAPLVPADAAPRPIVGQSNASNAVIVAGRQRGNPVIPFIKGVRWEYGDILPDYQVGAHTCVLYLSLRYHRLHPEYLHGRIEKIQGMFQLRVLLVLCDVNDHQESIREITKICIINNLTVVVAWTPEEAGKYLATYKLFEHKSPDILKERTAADYQSQLHRALTSIRGVNKTDVLTLSTSFGTFDRMVNATNEELAHCPGVGDVKVRRLLEAFSTPFRGGPPSQAIVDAKGKQRALEEMGVGRVATGGKGKGKERERVVDSPDWPDDDDDDVVVEDAPAAGRAGSKKTTVRDPSPVWPDNFEDDDDGPIDIDDILAEGEAAEAVKSQPAGVDMDMHARSVSPAKRPNPFSIDE